MNGRKGATEPFRVSLSSEALVVITAARRHVRD